jgi:hypothetical protein
LKTGISTGIWEEKFWRYIQERCGWTCRTRHEMANRMIDSELMTVRPKIQTRNQETSVLHKIIQRKESLKLLKSKNTNIRIDERVTSVRAATDLAISARSWAEVLLSLHVESSRSPRVANTSRRRRKTPNISPRGELSIRDLCDGTRLIKHKSQSRTDQSRVCQRV